MTITLDVLNAATVARRQRKCSSCPHAIPGPIKGMMRKWWCAKLFNGNKTDRAQRAYLPTLTENPLESCPLPEPEWIAATEDEYLKVGELPHQPHRMWYEALWHEIHGRTEPPTQSWIASIIVRLPGCCRPHFIDWLSANPPRVGIDPFDWGYALHDDVNKLLGKTRPTREEAWQRWRTKP